MEITIELIRAKLTSDDKWLVRGMLAIFDHQTASEQTSEQTHENNGVGFNGTDAAILSSFSKFYATRGFLTEKQLAIARRKMPKYSKQLLGIAKRKAAAKAAQQVANDIYDAACVAAERLNDSIIEHGSLSRQLAREMEERQNA